MIISDWYGLFNRHTHDILCESKEEKKAIINYLNENYEDYDYKTEPIESEELKKALNIEEAFYIQVKGPKELKSNEIMEWYKNENSKNQR